MFNHSITKINHISFNEMHNRFSLSYNNGIYIYNFKNLELLYSCFNLGDIYMSKLVYEIDIILFFGNENNNKYLSNKLVLFDIKEQKELSTEIFKNKLIDIQIQQKYVLSENEEEINIHKINNFNALDFCQKIELPYKLEFPFVTWSCETKYYILYQKEIKKIEIINLVNINDYLFIDSTKTKIVALPHKKVQKIFYEPVSKNIFVVNGPGDKIYEIDIKSGEQIKEYYRGNSNGTISDIINIVNKYILICNSNRTIHVFNILNKSSNSNIFNLISSYTINLNSENLYYSILKIKFDEIFKNENTKFEKDFELKGAILHFEKEEGIIKVICYNGIVIHIHIDYQTPKYYCHKKINFINENKKSDLINDF